MVSGHFAIPLKIIHGAPPHFILRVNPVSIFCLRYLIEPNFLSVYSKPLLHIFILITLWILLPRVVGVPTIH